MVPKRLLILKLCLFCSPIQEQVPIFPAAAAFNLEECSTAFNGAEWEGWARDQVMVDGCDIVGKISLPQVGLSSFVIVLKFISRFWC